MVLSNLRKSIFYLQQAINETRNKDIELLNALNIMKKIENKKTDVNDPKFYNTTEI